LALNIWVTGERPFSKTVHLEGRLNNETVGALDAELGQVAASPAKVVVLDLAGLSYINSEGLRSIFRFRKTMAARSGEMLLVNLQPPVKKVFEIVRAVDVATVFASVEELDAYLDLMQRKVADQN
jgi:anti-sigma B factor antagonist